MSKPGIAKRAEWYNFIVKQEDRGRFGTIHGLRDRAAALAKFQAWDREHGMHLEPAMAISAVNSLYRLLPKEARSREEDSRFSGVQRMLDALGRLGRPGG